MDRVSFPERPSSRSAALAASEAASEAAQEAERSAAEAAEGAGEAEVGGTLGMLSTVGGVDVIFKFEKFVQRAPQRGGVTGEFFWIVFPQ